MLIRSAQLFFVFALLSVIAFPVKAFAADANVGNEVVDTADATLIRTGSGTAAVPYKLQLNLGNANTWTAAQIFNNTLTANGILNLGDGGDAASLSGTSVKVNIGDNISEGFGLKQGTNNYFIVNTTNGAENVAFGNASTNPTFSFLGSGTATYAGDVAVGGGDITTTASTASLFNTTVTTTNIAGASTNVILGANTGTTTIRNNTFSLPNATALNATSALASFDSLNVGGGYGSTGVTISNTGNLSTDGSITVDGSGTIAGNATVAGDTAVNGGDVTTTAATGSFFNTNVTTLNIGGAATIFSLGSSNGTTTVNNDLSVGGSLTANTSTFSPSGSDDVTVNTDSDSFLVLTGLSTATGEGLCIDASDNVVKCSAALLNGKSVDYEKMTAALTESNKEQQKEIDQLKKDIAELKSLINN